MLRFYMSLSNESIQLAKLAFKYRSRIRLVVSNSLGKRHETDVTDWDTDEWSTVLAQMGLLHQSDRIAKWVSARVYTDTGEDNDTD